jgi:gliding motility-associated lipoprotein GldH
MKLNFCCTTILVIVSFFSCNTQVCYNKIYKIQSNLKRDSVFEFNVTCNYDTVDIDLIVENKYSYKYSNFFVQAQFFINDSLASKKFFEVILMDQKTGKPLGRGSFGNYHHQVSLYRGVSLNKKKGFKIYINHFMRDYIVEEITKIGLVVKKFKK